MHFCSHFYDIALTDTGENVQKWTRVYLKKSRKYSRPLLDVFARGQVSSPRLYRLSLVRKIIIKQFHFVSASDDLFL